MNVSTEDIQTAIGSMNTLAEAYNGKKQEIDRSVEDALRAISASVKSFYVDQANGDNANVGGAEAPLQSMQEAFSRTPAGGVCNIVLLGDYRFQDVERANAITVLVNGNNRPKIQFDWQSWESNPGMISRLGGIQPDHTADFRFEGVDIEFPVDPPEPFQFDHMNSLISNNGSQMPAMIAAKFTNVNFYHLGTKASIFGNTWSFIATRFVNCTFPSGFEGRVREGVGGSGVDPDTVVRHVSTNLSWI